MKLELYIAGELYDSIEADPRQITPEEAIALLKNRHALLLQFNKWEIMAEPAAFVNPQNKKQEMTDFKKASQILNQMTDQELAAFIAAHVEPAAANEIQAARRAITRLQKEKDQMQDYIAVLEKLLTDHQQPANQVHQVHQVPPRPTPEEFETMGQAPDGQHYEMTDWQTYHHHLAEWQRKYDPELEAERFGWMALDLNAPITSKYVQAYPPARCLEMTHDHTERRDSGKPGCSDQL